MARTRYDDRPRVAGDDWGQYPLAPSPSRPTAPPTAAPAPAGATRRRRPAAPAPSVAVPPAALNDANDSPLPLDPATIVLSLPIAVSLGQLNVPAAVGWTALLIGYRVVTRPGVLRGTLDFLVDGLDVSGDMRRRLGVPDQLPRPSGGTAASVWDVPGAIVSDWSAAIGHRRGEVVAGVQAAVASWHLRPDTVGDSNGDGAAEGRTMRLRPDAPGVADQLAAIDAQVERPPAEIPGMAQVRLSEIANLDNIWVVGPKGTGKTTTLRKLIALRRGQHIAIDPHSTPGKWGSATVIGGGRDFPAIDLQIDKMIGMMDQRYKAQAAGTVTEEQCKAARRTLVGDEWRSIRKNLPGAKATRDKEATPSAAERLLDIISEGRKAGICALTASHADTAESMGVSGEKDILRCFDVIIYLGGMATKYRPEASVMERPALLYDPEREVWAQLIIDGPVIEAPAPAALAEQLDEEATVEAPTVNPLTGVTAQMVRAPLDVEQRQAQHARVAPAAAAPSPAMLSLAELYEHAPSLALRRGYVPTPEQVARKSAENRAALAQMLEQEPAPAAASAPVASAAPTSAPSPVQVPSVTAEPLPEQASPPAPPDGREQTVTVDEGARQIVVKVTQFSGGRGVARRPTPAKGGKVKPATVGRSRVTQAAPVSDAERVAAWLRANPDQVLRTDAGAQLKRGAKTRIAELLGISYSGTANCERIDKAAVEGLELLSSGAK